MHVILFRHGIAEAVGPSAQTDFERPLSEDGRVRTRQAAMGLCRLLPEGAVRVVSSPLVRAQQTAQCLVEALPVASGIETCEDLALGADLGEVQAFVDAGDRDGTTVLVGHEPDMRRLAAYWLTRGDGISVRFKKAAALCIAFDGPLGLGLGTLAWFLPPRVLRWMA